MYYIHPARAQLKVLAFTCQARIQMLLRLNVQIYTNSRYIRQVYVQTQRYINSVSTNNNKNKARGNALNMN